MAELALDQQPFPVQWETEEGERFHVYIPQGMIKEREFGCKSQPQSGTQVGGEGFGTQTSPCVRKSAFFKSFDILKEGMLDKHQV